jgi:hypothetical protein
MYDDYCMAGGTIGGGGEGSLMIPLRCVVHTYAPKLGSPGVLPALHDDSTMPKPAHVMFLGH